MGSGQLLGNLALEPGHERALELALQVGADFLAEGVEVAILDAEGLGERSVHLGQLRLLHLDDVQADRGGFAGQLRVAEVRGKIDGGVKLFACSAVQQRIVQGLEQVAGAEHAAGALEPGRREAVVPGTRGVFEAHEVAGRRGPLDVIEMAPLQLQGAKHLVDVLITYRRRDAVDLQLADVDVGQFRHDLERCRIGNLAVQRLAVGVDGGIGDGAQVFLRHRLAEGAVDQARQHLVAHLRAKALLDNRRRHLARAKALQAHRASHLRDSRLDLRLVALGREFHREPALELADVLYRNLHDLS